MARRKGEVHITGPSLKPWYGYLDRLADEPTQGTLVKLNSILDMAFYTAGFNVHVETGRLRASVRASSNHVATPRTNRWEGFVGLGLGVPYAKYETGERRRGSRPDWVTHPSHDPYDGLGEMYYPAIDAVLNSIGPSF